MEKYQNYARLISAPGSVIVSPTVTVYNVGTLVLATIYDDDLSTPTPKSNPFTADAFGYYYFYAPNGRYDVKTTGGTPALVAVTLGDITFGVGDSGVPTYTFAGLPVSGSVANKGRLARVSNKSRGLWMDSGVSWASLNAEWFDTGQFNLVGDGVTDNSDNMDILLAAVEALDVDTYRGSVIQFPYGIFYFSRGIALNRKIILRGSGCENSAVASQATQSNTCLLVPAGIDGITISSANHGFFSHIESLEIRASGKTSTKHGIVMAGRARIKDVHVVGFKGHGINITASSASGGNSNAWYVEQTRIDSNDGDGLHVSGTDANAGNAIGVDCSNNGGWGFYNNATYGSTYTGCSDEGNTTGGIYSTNRSVYMGHYNEGGQPENQLNQPGVILGGTFFGDFAAGMAPMRLGDDKINLGSAMNPSWVTAGISSVLSRGFYCDQGASIINEILGFAATGRVAHGMISYAPTATWMSIGQATASGGGALVYGLSEIVTALDFRGYGTGEDTSRGAGALGPISLQGGRKSGTGATTVSDTANLILFSNAGTNKSFILGDGSLYVRGINGMTFGGDVVRIGTTTTTNMLIGYRADVGTSANEFLSFQGTGRINQGATTLASANTLCCWTIAGVSGGVQQLYFSAANQSMDARGIATTEDTTQGNASVAPITFNSFKINGTGTTTLGATANLVVMGNAGNAQFIFRADGSSFENVGTLWTNFDAYEDAELLTALSVAVSKKDDPFKALYMDTLMKYRDVLQEHDMISIITNEDGSTSVFVNTSRIQMLLVGAVRQLATAVNTLKTDMLLLTTRVNLLLN